MKNDNSVQILSVANFSEINRINGIINPAAN